MHKSGLLLVFIVLFSACSRTVVKKENYDDGKIKSEKTYKKINGKEQLIKEVQYHPNGNKYMEGNYTDELRDGHWVSWYSNGTVWSEGDFVKGESHGRRTVYFTNGSKYYEGNYNMGKRTGLWVFYDETGNKVKEVNYDKETEITPETELTAPQ